MNKLMTFATVFGVVTYLIASGSLSAAQEGRKGQGRDREQQGRGMIDRLDEDSDRKISTDEFPGDEDQFGELDSNGDGFIDEAELEARRGVNSGERGHLQRGRFDKDGDGRISAEEFPGDPGRFEELDSNGDGFVWTDEMPGRGRGSRRRSASEDG